MTAASGYIDIYSLGHISSSGNIPLYSRGLDYLSNSVDTYCRGYSTISTTLNIGDYGWVDLTSDLFAELTTDQWAGLPLYTDATYPENFGLYLYTNGHIPSIVSLPLYLQSDPPQIGSSVDLFLKTNEGISGAVDLYIGGEGVNWGYYPISTSLPLIIPSNGVYNNVDMFCKVISGTTNTYVDMFVEGCYNIDGSINLVIPNTYGNNSVVCKLFMSGY